MSVGIRGRMADSLSKKGCKRILDGKRRKARTAHLISSDSLRLGDVRQSEELSVVYDQS
jgi:hypothetical protein